MVLQVEAFKYAPEQNKLEVLDQLRLPGTISYITVRDSEMGFRVIKEMNVRGAPCIAAVACLSIVVEMVGMGKFEDTQMFIDWLGKACHRMQTSRSTAVNLKQALDKLMDHANRLQSGSHDVGDMIKALADICSEAIEAGRTCNIQLGDLGAESIISRSGRRAGLKVLTHCNTGSLASVGYGTALGVIRSLRAMSCLGHVFCTETRPYLQGSRLTAWELVQEEIPATLITDSMVASLFKSQDIDAVVVGADRVAANGDTANKIGTYQIALLASLFKVPFYVAAPTQSIDINTPNGDYIKIELRPEEEVKRLGNEHIAPDEVHAWNPSFDVTPAALITSIITECGCFEPEGLGSLISTGKTVTKALF